MIAQDGGGVNDRTVRGSITLGEAIDKEKMILQLDMWIWFRLRGDVHVKTVCVATMSFAFVFCCSVFLLLRVAR
jgi:hypothetical protein